MMLARVHHNPSAFAGFFLLIITLSWDSISPKFVLGFTSGPPRARACPLQHLPLLTLDCLQPSAPGSPQSCALISPDTDLQTITTTTTDIPSNRRQLDENARLDEPTRTGDVIYRTAVRPCTCQSNNFYHSFCPGGLNLCVTSSNSGWKCQPANTLLGDLSRAVWPFACVMLILIFSCLVGTSHGHQAILCSGNRWYAAYLLRRRPMVARRLIRQWVRRRRPTLEARYRGLLQTDGSTTAPPRRLRRMEERMVQSAVEEQRMRQPTRMLLPVRKYRRRSDQQKPKEDSSSRVKVSTADDVFNNEEDDEALLCDLGPTCTICYGPLNEGDRVGDLPCGHIFHSECLKVWLPRRNVCPLCLDGDIAKEERGVEPAPTITTSEEQFGSIADSIISVGGPTDGAAQIISNVSEDESAARRSVTGSVDSGVLAHPMQQEMLNESDPPFTESNRSDEEPNAYDTAGVSDSEEPSGSETSV